MNKIAIFVSGTGEAAERIVKLFNEGNRVRTLLIVVNALSEECLENLRKYDIPIIETTDEEWPVKALRVASLIREKAINLIVLDNFDLVLPDEVMEATEGEILKVTSPELAPREVVNTLEKDLRKPQEEKEEVKQEEENPTPESEWADALKINFTPPKVPTTPPELPKKDQIEEIDVNISTPSSEQPRNDNSFNRFFEPRRFEEERRHRDENKTPQEPMPSTWLIWSILVTVFCCFIPGIVAIIFSSQVSTRYYSGDLEGAKRASRAAEIWIIVSVVIGVIAATLYFPFMFLG